MREIKFRAWDEQNKVMHNEVEFIRSGIDGNDWILFKSDKQKLEDGNVLNNPYFQQQIKLMQYTGLKDKNDVEIYESDIIKAIWSKDCDEYIANEEWIGDIFFNYGSFDINGEWCVSLNCFNGTLEVIGNIYENKQLLN